LNVNQQKDEYIYRVVVSITQETFPLPLDIIKIKLGLMEDDEGNADVYPAYSMIDIGKNRHHSMLLLTFRVVTSTAGRNSLK
jgi:hypothetical protein